MSSSHPCSVREKHIHLESTASSSSVAVRNIAKSDSRIEGLLDESELYGCSTTAVRPHQSDRSDGALSHSHTAEILIHLERNLLYYAAPQTMFHTPAGSIQPGCIARRNFSRRHTLTFAVCCAPSLGEQQRSLFFDSFTARLD